MSPGKKQILVIDDQTEIRELVVASITGPDYHVLQAASGREGLKVAQDRMPDLIFLDIMMPEFDGIATCQALKHNPKTKHIPIVFLTAKQSKKDVQAAIMAGGKDYIVKPFTSRGLMERVLKFAPLTNESGGEPAESGATRDMPAATEADSAATVQTPRLDVRRNGSIATLTADYEVLHRENYLTLRSVFSELLTVRTAGVVLDICRLRSLDAAGLGLLVSMDEVLRKRQGGLRLSRQPKTLLRNLSLLHLTDLFHPYADARDAADSIENAPPAPALPDLIILDVMMPGGLDGFDVCKTLKDGPDTRHIHILMLTAKGQEADKEKGAAAGADSYFIKPFSPFELLKKIEDVLN